MQAPQPADVRQEVLAHAQLLKNAVDTLRFAPEHWHTTLLIELAGENLINALEFINGVMEANVCRCAWAGRNLLEVHYFTRFVMGGEENARRFFEDMLPDFQDLVKTYMKSSPEHADSLTTAQGILDMLWSRPDVSTKRHEGYLSSWQIAKSFGEEVPFGSANKFLSKFVHPTALSIQLKKSPAWDRLILPVMMQSIVPIIRHTFPMLSRYINEFSARPA